MLKELERKFKELNVVITDREEFDKKYEDYLENWTNLVSDKRLKNIPL